MNRCFKSCTQLLLDKHLTFFQASTNFLVKQGGAEAEMRRPRHPRWGLPRASPETGTRHDMISPAEGNERSLEGKLGVATDRQRKQIKQVGEARAADRKRWWEAVQPTLERGSSGAGGRRRLGRGRRLLSHWMHIWWAGAKWMKRIDFSGAWHIVTPNKIRMNSLNV